MASTPELTDSSLTIDGRVATLTFERDDVRNALTGTALITELVTVIDWSNDNPEVSVLIVTGEGNAFSAGGNIKNMGSHAESPAFRLHGDYKRDIQRIPHALQHAQIPIIAAINGPAIGAGFDLANMCDLRIASSKAKFGETFVNLGIVPAIGGSWFLQRLVGFQRAVELTLSGRIIDAAEAEALGIVLEVTEPDALLPRAYELAAAIAAKPPVAVRYAKQLLRLGQTQPLAEYLEVCASYQAFCQKTDDHREALDAMLEKRAGQFSGS
jgi:enoyl-CoA hydratase/carnithine racemase